MDYHRLTWSDVESSCKRISEKIIGKGLGDRLLVGISRGGLVPLRLISDHLYSRKVSTLGIRFYEELGVHNEVPEVFLPVQGDVAGKDIVLVDDISDTGESLLTAKDHLYDKGAKDIVVSAICFKPHTALIPDIYDFRADNWVIFPWEVQETMKLIGAAYEDRESALQELEKAGFQREEYLKVLDELF